MSGPVGFAFVYWAANVHAVWGSELRALVAKGFSSLRIICASQVLLSRFLGIVVFGGQCFAAAWALSRPALSGATKSLQLGLLAAT